MESIIQYAIQYKQCLSFSYGGHNRVVEPHVLGIIHGVNEILCYQIGGSSNSGRIPEWRRFKLKDIRNITKLEQNFAGKRDCPSGQHSSWDRVICIVS